MANTRSPTDKSPSRRQRLEVPSVSPLARRLLVDSAPVPPPKRPRVSPPEPSSLLTRLQTFLPALQSANADLAQQLQHAPACAVQIEHADAEEDEDGAPEGPYVSMEVACGVVDLKDAAALAAAERAVAKGAVHVLPGSPGTSSGSSGGSAGADSSSADSSSRGSFESGSLAGWEEAGPEGDSSCRQHRGQMEQQHSAVCITRHAQTDRRGRGRHPGIQEV